MFNSPWDNVALPIGLDATYGVGKNLSGVGVYCRELICELAERHPESRLHLYYRPHRLSRALTVPANASRRILFEPFFTPARESLFHGLNQRLPKCPLKRAVCTFHDLFVLTGNYSTPDFQARFAGQARDSAARSDLIIAVSEFTAGQVKGLLGVEASKVRVVPHGVRTPLLKRTPQQREKIVLSVGALQTRKNLVRLIEAFGEIPPDWKLVLAGSDGFGADQIHHTISASRARTRITALGYVSAEELEQLYARASIFAFPSLDEGFGMPVLEAMSRGLPVITSNGSALPEVAGDAAMIVDPFSTEQIAEGLQRLIADPELRRRLGVAGQRRASVFPWARVADATWAVYQELGLRI